MSEIELQLKFGKGSFKDAQEGINDAINLIRATWEGEVRQVSQALKDYLTVVAAELAKQHGGSWPGGTTANSLSMRTGASVNSITRSVKVTGTTWENLSGQIGGRATLAIHESGGTIRARGKMLTIPLPAALSSRGTSPPFARQWKNTFVARTKKGNLLIFQKRGGDIVPLYVLKTSVRIPARLGMQKKLTEKIPYFLSRAADLVVRDFVQQIG